MVDAFRAIDSGGIDIHPSSIRAIFRDYIRVIRNVKTATKVGYVNVDRGELSTRKTSRVGSAYNVIEASVYGVPQLSRVGLGHYRLTFGVSIDSSYLSSGTFRFYGRIVA